MMGEASCLFLSLLLLVLSFSSLLSSQAPLPPAQLQCHDDERSALLEFKSSLRTTDQSPSPSCLDSWKMEEGARNCCSWHGVRCGGPSSHVIGLNLSYCELYGSINSNSSIFRLVHLQVLDLEYNNFIGLIPPSISNLTQLVTLDLSINNFHGPVPSEIGSLTHLQKLDLSSCSFQGTIPQSISNLTQLVTLNLGGYFHGSFPSQIVSLTNLEELDLSECDFKGPIPPSVSNLTRLVTLGLSYNSFQGPILPFILNMTWLVDLDLCENQFTGEIPPSIANLIQLTSVDLDKNQFTGEIPYQIASLTHLQVLDLSFNRFHGQIPSFLPKLRNITLLLLGPNNLTGVVQLDMFSGMERLEELILSFNNISLAIGSATNYSFQNVRILGLAQCNLKEFPAFLEKLDNLTGLDLQHNNLSGEIPEWFLNGRLPSLRYLNLSGNSLTGFPRDFTSYNSTQLQYLDLSFNKLQGSLPIPSGLPLIYRVSNNMLSGEIPKLICDRQWGPQFLDLSRNNFTGELPQCLSQFSESLTILALHSNNFHGRIPSFGSSGNGCMLEMIDLSDNQLQGPLPRSLSNCLMLRFLNVGNNRISDTFPSWLGSLSSLRVLILRSNCFHGGIEQSKSESGNIFPGLQIIDISLNKFQGSLPSEYFRYWKYMGESGHQDNSYLSVFVTSAWVVADNYPMYELSMTIINKGVEMEYGKILGFFKVVDLSSNNFTGEISDSIASLHGLHLLNLSHNLLVGSIPPSLGALTQLEALDLSRNGLTGEIPQQLVEFPSLSIFNVSYNNLSGRIPQGKQFGSFPNSSYWGNSGLCGDPLSRECGSSEPQPPPPSKSTEKDEGFDEPFEIEWRAVAVGYAVTFVIAAVIGHNMITKHGNWFARTLGLRQLRSRR